ncbi:TonB-dependent receptor [Pseudothauera rhizosphaerae]|nr:TonB-dependent receptor [Pseudothauera rhizosphaerae]
MPATRSPRFPLNAIAAAILAMAPACSPAADAGGQADAATLSPVTVTANKIEQDVQSVPQSITVIDGATLEERGINKVADLLGEIPNMYSNAAGGHGMGISFRGLNASMFTNNNPIVVYIDGVAYSSRYGFDPSLANVERIEVLRGPQGSLYGKDAIGAVINIVTKKPENDWHGTAGVEIAEDDGRLGTFNASGALVKDALYAGINGQYGSSDGWIENTWPGMKKDASAHDNDKLSAYLLWTPNTALSAKLALSQERYTARWYEGTQAGPGGSPLGFFKRDAAEKASYDVAPKEKGDTDAQSLLLTYRMGAVTLDSVTTHKTFTLDGIYDADFGVNPLYAGLTQFNHSETETWSQEIRLSSSATTGLRWVAGVYFEKESHDQGPYGMQMPVPPLGNFEMNADSTTDTQTHALFGQIIYPFGKAELTLGGRYQSIEKEFQVDTYYLPVGMAGPAMYGMEDTKRWNQFLPRAALSYAIDPRWTAYVSYSKGYMPGGYNYFSSSGAVADNRFKPQISDNYEIGIRGRGEHLTVAANLFHMDIEDVHIYKAVGALYTTSNARKAHSTGAEVELTWHPVRNWELGGALGVIDAKYKSYDAGTHDFDGKKIENTPSHTLRLSAAWLSPGGAYARVDVRNVGRVMFYDDAVKGFAREDGYTTVDLKAGYRFADWDLYAYVHNATDEEYTSGFMSNYAITMASFGAPRKIGVGARYSF